MRTLFGKTNSNMPSRFLKEIPQEVIESPSRAKESYGGGSGTSYRLGQARPFGPNTTASSFGQSTNMNSNRPVTSTPMAASTVNGVTDFRNGDKVVHNKWGTGTIVAVKGTGEDMELNIAFPAPVGVKRLLAKFAPITKA
jgi:DNA helicase II / ATP-dependent DNA helicase PcrA